MTKTPPAWRYTAVAILCVSLLAGAWLRISGVATRSITHPEMYVPNIPLPEGISEPAERVTVSRILTGTFSSDTHPPGYYLLMLPYTRIAGTSLTAIRLPSALFGVFSIALVFYLGVLAGRPLSGSVAAALLAFSGYHVFWSQVARMFALNCFLGLAATVLLVLMAKNQRRRTVLLAIYVFVMLAGVACHVFFWSLFAAHFVWTFVNATGRRQLPDLCRAQLLAFILGSPLIAFAAYQSGNTVADLSSDVWLYVSQFLSFAFALPAKNSGFFLSGVPYTSGILWTAGRWVLTLMGVVLLVAGLRQLLRTQEAKPAALGDSSGAMFWRAAWLAAGLIGTIEIVGFLYLVRTLPPAFINSTVRITTALSILPLVLTVSAFVLDWIWARTPAAPRWQRILTGEGGLIAVMAILPLVALLGLAQFRPILNQRGLLFACPYLLLVIAVGIATLRRKVWIAALAPVLIVTCAASLKGYSQMTVDPVDYGGFATSIQAEIGSGDLVFVRKAWYETPILYYLHKDRYHLVGRDFARACSRNPNARVWVVLLYDADPPRDMQEALTGYQILKTVTAPNAKAILYEHRAS